jgi:diacylglycerol kinase family enzyme
MPISDIAVEHDARLQVAQRCNLLDATRPHRPLCIVINAGAGHAAAGVRVQTIREQLHAAGRDFQLFEVGKSVDLLACTERAVRAAEAADGVIVASGGDGTLNAVVQRARHSSAPFAILPQGTFNYFGRGLGVSSDLPVALAGLLDAEPVDVGYGLVNDHAFLVNASLGLYPQLLEEREVAKQQFGRSRTVALLAAVRSLLARHPCMNLQIESETTPERTLRTPTLFVGNSELQLAQLGIDEAKAVARGRLAAVAIDDLGRWRMLGLVLRAAFGQLGKAQTVESFAFRQLRVDVGRSSAAGSSTARSRRIKLACDGETLYLRTPLLFRVAPKPLRMLLPRRALPAESGSAS